jgi:hypothetical protein
MNPEWVLIELVEPKERAGDDQRSEKPASHTLGHRQEADSNSMSRMTSVRLFNVSNFVVDDPCRVGTIRSGINLEV